MFLLLTHFLVFTNKIDNFTYKYNYSENNNKVIVKTNSISFKKGIKKHFEFGGTFLIDAITAASRVDYKASGIDGTTSSTVNVDGITSASKTKENRYQFGLSLSTFFDFISKIKKSTKKNLSSIGLSYSDSREEDYLSKTISLNMSKSLFQKNSVISIDCARSIGNYYLDLSHMSAPNDAGWSFFDENGKKLIDRIKFKLQQNISKTTTASVIVGYGYSRGYLAKPYRMIKIGGTGLNRYYTEQLPCRRTNFTYSLYLNKYFKLMEGFSLQGNYRFYHDSWHMKSHTFAIKPYLRIIDKIIIRPSYRFYYQGDAFFYEDKYKNLPEYFTTDFKYGKMFTNTLGLKLIYQLRNYAKSKKNPIFTLYPVKIDIAGFYMFRSSTTDSEIRDIHYNYWSIEDGFRHFWIQTGVKFAF